jgi:hypothetical protein
MGSLKQTACRLPKLVNVVAKLPCLEKAVVDGGGNSGDFSSNCPSLSLKPFSELRIMK